MTWQQWRPVVAVLLGALLGFALGAGSYLALVSVLEAAGGAVEELQGLVWNLVPLGTVVGGVLGGVLERRHGDR